MKNALSNDAEAKFLSDTLKLINENKEFDTSILVPLVRRRARETMFSSATRDAIFTKLGIDDHGKTDDEYWIEKENSFFYSLSSVWSAVMSFFEI
jgi:hypothetical protein